MQVYFIYLVPVTLTFVAVLAFLALTVGVGVIEFVVNHIIVLSLIFWVPILLLIVRTWQSRSVSEENKVKSMIYPLLQVPTYAALIQVLNYCIKDSGLFYQILTMVFTGPVVLLSLGFLQTGIAWLFVQLYKRVLRSKFMIFLAGIMVTIPWTYFLWNMEW